MAEIDITTVQDTAPRRITVPPADPLLDTLRTLCDMRAQAVLPEPRPLLDLAAHAEALRLAVEGYDDTARCEIECHAGEITMGNLTWYDTSAPDFGDDPFLQEFIDRATHYLRLRGHLITHPTRAELVRFAHPPNGHGHGDSHGSATTGA